MSAAPIPQGDAPPIPAWLIDRCPSHVWAAAWETCAKQQAAALAASEARYYEAMAEAGRYAELAARNRLLAEAAEQSLAEALKDIERLDYLIQHSFCIKQMGDTGQFMATDSSGYPCTGGEFDTPRQAIDAVIQETNHAG